MYLNVSKSGFKRVVAVSVVLGVFHFCLSSLALYFLYVITVQSVVSEGSRVFPIVSVNERRI